MIFDGKLIFITGGTGYLGRRLIRRLLSGQEGFPEKIIVLCRSENSVRSIPKDEIIQVEMGDLDNISLLRSIIKETNIVMHLAAVKQIPLLESFPEEAIRVNLLSTQNILQAVKEVGVNVESVLGISTDKACKPVNVYGMCKALMERLLCNCKWVGTGVRMFCVRYGNVINSTGSVIPLFLNQIKSGDKVTITNPSMTRFFISSGKAINAIFDSLKRANCGDIFIPHIKSYRLGDIPKLLDPGCQVQVTGTRPGEKIHEILVSEEELSRTAISNGYFSIRPFGSEVDNQGLSQEYSSRDNLMSDEEMAALIKEEMHEPVA